MFLANNSKSDLETATVMRGDVIEEVRVTGKIKPAASVELAFDNSGRISKVSGEVGTRVSAGQILAELYNADIISDLIGSQANLKSQEAQLADLKNGPRPEDIEISKAKVNNARRDLADKIEEAYTKADDAIHAKVDQFISNPNTNPQLNFLTDGQLKADIESARFQLNSRFKIWASSMQKFNANENLYSFAGEANDQLRIIRSFLDVVAISVNDLGPTAGLSQTAVDLYRADVSTARTNVNSAINNISSAVSSLKVAESELAKANAGSTLEEILVAEANVEKAKAQVEGIRAKLSKTRIISPITGVITKQDAKVGQIVSASAPLVSVISDAKFEIEANLPETDISKIRVGDSAKLTLDAYGSGIFFDVRVISVDPAETVIEGVSTYKITLAFLRDDGRIKSGLSADINILGMKHENVLYAPLRAIVLRDGIKYVRVQNADGRVDEIMVETGLTGSGGKVEIISGVSEGLTIITSASTP